MPKKPKSTTTTEEVIMPTFDLPPSATDRTVSITVPKAWDPYFVQFFQEKKKPGDSASSFLLGYMGSLVADWWGQKKGSDLEAILQAEITTINTDINAFKTLHNIDY